MKKWSLNDVKKIVYGCRQNQDLNTGILILEPCLHHLPSSSCCIGGTGEKTNVKSELWLHALYRVYALLYNLHTDGHRMHWPTLKTKLGKMEPVLCDRRNTHPHPQSTLPEVWSQNGQNSPHKASLWGKKKIMLF